MLRVVLLGIILLSLMACTPDPVLDLVQLEAQARGGDQAAISQFVDLLGSEATDVADRSYTVLIELGEQAAPALIAKVDAADRQQREYVIAALGTLKVVDAIPAISTVLTDTTLKRRYVAAWALGEIGAVEALPALIRALSDDNSEVRRYATRALIKFHKSSVLPLVDYLAQASGEGAAGAVRALGDIADPRALEVLLIHARGAQRAEAFLALGKLRDSRAESALIAGLTDADERVRMNAAMALGPLGGTLAEKPLRKSLEDDVHVVREWSARSLEMITGQPVLYRNSHDEFVRPYTVYH